MALVLLIINLCGTITLIGLIPLPQTQSSSRNKNETIPNSTELNETQIKTQSNLDEDEFVLSYKQISPQNSSKNDSKNYKKSGEESYMFIVLLLDTLTIFNNICYYFLILHVLELAALIIVLEQSVDLDLDQVQKKEELPI